MINIKNKYYLYSHTILDTNTIFYIGIGTKKYGESDYIRAFSFSKKGRNSAWHIIFKKCKRNIQVDILEEFNNQEKCKKKRDPLYFYVW